MNNEDDEAAKVVGISCVKILAWVLLLYKVEANSMRKIVEKG